MEAQKKGVAVQTKTSIDVTQAVSVSFVVAIGLLSAAAIIDTFLVVFVANFS